MNIQTPIVADVFTQEAQAKHALEALRLAGFDYNQVGIAMQGHEGIDLLNDLLNLGVPHELASYYAQEVKAGHIVVSVRPDGREQEAHDIMRRSGAYDILRSNDAYDSHHGTASPQTATNIDDVFHQPRSLKPREEQPNVMKERVQTEEGELRQDEVTEQKPGAAPVMHEKVMSEQGLLLKEQVETTPIDEEKTTRPPVSEEQFNTETLSPHMHMKKNRSVKRVLNGVLLGGLLLGLGVGALVALMREQKTRLLVGERVQRLQRVLSRIGQRSPSA